MSAHDIVKKLRELEKSSKLEGLSHGARGAIVGTLNTAFGSDQMRRVALWFIFDATKESIETGVSEKSTKNISMHEWGALESWIDMYKDEEDNEWHVSETFKSEAAELRAAIEEVMMKLWKQGLVPEPTDIPDSLVEEAMNLGGVVVHTWVEGSQESDFVAPEEPVRNDRDLMSISKRFKKRR